MLASCRPNLCVLLLFCAAMSAGANAQQGAGPFVMHPGKVITTNFANEFGKDADARTEVTSVTPEVVSLQYSRPAACLPAVTSSCATGNRHGRMCLGIPRGCHR